MVATVSSARLCVTKMMETKGRFSTTGASHIELDPDLRAGHPPRNP